MVKNIPMTTGEFILVEYDGIGFDGGPFVNIQIVEEINEDFGARHITADEVDTYGQQILAAIKEAANEKDR